MKVEDKYVPAWDWSLVFILEVQLSLLFMVVMVYKVSEKKKQKNKTTGLLTTENHCSMGNTVLGSHESIATIFLSSN